MQEAQQCCSPGAVRHSARTPRARLRALARFLLRHVHVHENWMEPEDDTDNIEREKLKERKRVSGETSVSV